MIACSFAKKLSGPEGSMQLLADFELSHGSFTIVYGPSGAGKTSLLRCIAGLMKPEKGMIKAGSEIWYEASSHTNLPPQRRRTALVFQDYALFPNMTVQENLQFASSKKSDEAIVNEVMEIMELEALRSRKPVTLSGGQQQRIALARALVQQPELLMLDEPLSALDQKMRLKLQNYLLQAHRQFNLTTIMISHDIAEILKLADHIIVLDQGNIINQGSPTSVFTHQHISGKFRFTGELIAIENQSFIYILTILIGQDLVKVIADEDEVQAFKLGDKVMVVSKAFNPVVKKIDS